MADLAEVLACQSAAVALRAIEREMLAAGETRFAASTVLEAIGEGFGADLAQLEQVLTMIGGRGSDGSAAAHLAISMCGLERALIVKRLLGAMKGNGRA